MTTCQVCGGRSPNAYLCRDDQTKLANTLNDLPWWIDRLIETIIGQANLGTGSGKRIGPNLIGYSDPTTATDGQGGTEGQRRLERDLNNGALTQDWALGSGGLNAKASRVLDDVQATLTAIVRSLCETRGVELPVDFNTTRLNAPGGAVMTANVARWLTTQLAAIVAADNAGRIFGDITRLQTAIERAINRPITRKFLGPCPTCRYELWAREDTIQTTCPQCRNTHNCNWLRLILINDLERKRVTYQRILELNKMLPDEYQISPRSLRHWRKHGKLKIHGYLRHPDGREVISRHTDQDEPLYYWREVRKLHVEARKGRTA